MPFISQAQRAYMYAAADRGEIPKKTVMEFEKKTPKGKKLPYKVKKAEAIQAYWEARECCNLSKEASYPTELYDLLMRIGLEKEAGIFQTLGKKLHAAGLKELQLAKNTQRILKREEKLAKRFGKVGPITRREQRQTLAFNQAAGIA